MKTFRYFLYALIAAFVLPGCSDDPTYTPGEGEDPNSYGVYFPTQDNAADLELDPTDPTELTFTAKRMRDADAITVPVVITTEVQGVFATSEIDFAEGQTETTFKVSFPDAEVGKYYACSIQVTDPKYAYVYGANSTGIAFSITRVKWNQVKGPSGEELATWNEVIVGPLFSKPLVKGYCKVYERDDQKGLYRLENPYNEALVDKMFGTGAGPAWSWPANILVNATDANNVWIPKQEIGLSVNKGSDQEYGSISIASNVDENFSGSDKKYGTLNAGVFSFESGSIKMAMAKFQNGEFASNLDLATKFVILLPGAKETDYSLSLANDEAVDGKMNITTALGGDVAKVKYQFFKGVLNASAISDNSDDIDKGVIASKEITASGKLTVEFEETSMYTMVANIYDSANALKGTKTLVFGYLKKGDEVPVILNTGVIVSDKYASQGFTSENSVEIYINGEEIKSGYYGLFETEKLPANADLADIVKLHGEAFTAANIEAINSTESEGNFSGVISGLQGGTSYTLIVSANNGYVSKVLAAEATTLGKKDPLKRIYTQDDLYLIDNKADIFKTWNVWAIDLQGSSKNRQNMGTWTFSENTANDAPDSDAINLKGLTLGDIADDTIVWEFYKGIIYTLAAQPMGSVSGQGATYYLSYAFCDAETGKGTTGDYAMVGGYTEDGYIAFVGNSSDKTINLNTVWIRAFSDPAYTKFVGNWTMYHDVMLEDPASVEPSRIASAPVSQQNLRTIAAAAADPKNYVELRGSKRMHALIDEHAAQSSNKAMVFTPVEMPNLGVAKANISFEQGLSTEAKPFAETKLRSGVK